MYGRNYNGKTINFEASGGLIHSSLVMQDFETDSYWAIMKGEAIAGEFKGTKLHEMPVSQTMKWKDWKAAHPNTLVLSVGGREDGHDAYRDYFRSSRGFRGTSAQDSRLPTKAPIFAFHRGDKSYAIPAKAIEGGAALEIDGNTLFLYRPENAQIFYSTLAFIADGANFAKQDGKWQVEGRDCTFDPKRGDFLGSDRCPTRLEGGIDTFWYTWSLSNPETILLDPENSQ